VRGFRWGCFEVFICFKVTGGVVTCFYISNRNFFVFFFVLVFPFFCEWSLFVQLWCMGCLIGFVVGLVMFFVVFLVVQFPFNNLSGPGVRLKKSMPL